MGAASQGHLTVVQWLVLNGADHNIKDKFGVTALQYAEAGFHTSVVDYLKSI
jgi:ankyrin repeat protein